MTAAVAPGFADAALAGQAHFRDLLEAMARPGRIVRLGGELPAPPAPLHPASYALLLSLADFETPLWLDPALRQPSVEGTLRFHAGCPLTTDPASAAFAVAADAAALPALEGFAQGTPDYPDRSTTVLLQVAGLGAGEPLRLSGPGIDGGAGLAVRGVRPGLWAELRQNQALFPLGVDLVLVAGERLAALPRSTLVEPA